MAAGQIEPRTTQLPGFTQQVAHAMQSVGKAAGKSSGVDFAYLVKKAAVESSFDPRAKSNTSTATGLYQFTEGTWLDMVATHGHKHGLGREAAEITAGGLSASRKREILALREDPGLSMAMAAEYASDNRAHLARRVGGELGETELYLAHFLGPSGAESFLKALRADPDQPAAPLMPAAAKANRSIFYKDGQPRSLQAIYDRFETKFAKAEVPKDLVAALGLERDLGTGANPGAISPSADKGGWFAAPMDIRPSFSRSVGVGGWLAAPLTQTPVAVSTQVFLSHLALPGENSTGGKR